MPTTPTRCFVRPGQTDSIIDVINPDTGLTWVYGETLEQIQVRYPGAVEMSLDDFVRAKAATQDTPIKWEPSDRKTYWNMLEILPPAAMVPGGFLVGEPCDHHAITGRPRYQAYLERGRGQYVASSRPGE